MNDTKQEPKVDDPLGSKHRCRDFDEDCKDVPAPHRVFGSHVNCWLYAPERGWCPFLREHDK